VIKRLSGDIMKNKRVCKWKQGVTGRTPDGKVQKIEFPCRFPDEDLTPELCIQCLLGELFSMFYAQTMNMNKSMAMQEEIMAFLKSFTSDDFKDLR